MKARPDTAREMKRAFARVLALARKARLPEVEESTSYGTPALSVRGKSFMRMKDQETMVLLGPLEEKELLMASAPEIYFETDHYKGWPAFLVRLAKIGDDELKHRLAQAWRHKAPKRLIAERDRKNAMTPASRGRCGRGARP